MIIYFRGLILFLLIYDQVAEKMNFRNLYFLEYAIIAYISFFQCGVTFGVSYIIIKQLNLIFHGIGFHSLIKKENPEKYYPCLKTNNDNCEVIQLKYCYFINFYIFSSGKRI